MKLKTLIVIIIISLSVSIYLLCTLDNSDLQKQVADQSKFDEQKYEALGIKDAQADIEKGVLKIKLAGYPAPAINYYDQILSEHGIQLTLSGCAIEHKQRIYNQGYNQVMRFTIKAKYGPLFFTEAWSTAEQNFEDATKNQNQY